MVLSYASNQRIGCDQVFLENLKNRPNLYFHLPESADGGSPCLLSCQLQGQRPHTCTQVSQSFAMAMSSTEPWTTIFVAEWAFSCANIQATNMTIALNTLLFLLQSLSEYTKKGCENSLQLCICLSICKSRRSINHSQLNMHDLVPLHAPGITLAWLSKWTHCSQV